jgi:hypothetical protein
MKEDPSISNKLAPAMMSEKLIFTQYSPSYCR